MSNLDLQTLLAAAYGGQGGSGGGGGTGTSNYNDLSNRPKINGVTLSGDKTPEDLGIPTMTEGEKEKLGKVKETDTELSETSENNIQNKVVTGALKAVQEAVEGISDELDKKVDAETGKGLSTNDYDNTAKGIVDGITAKVDGKVDKVTGKGLSTNDFTDTLKEKLDDLPTIAAAVDGSTYTGADIADGGSTQAMQINTYNKNDSTYDAQAVNFSQNGITKYVRQKSDGSWKADATFMPDAVLQPKLDAKAAQSEVNALANAGAKNLLNVSNAVKATNVVDSVADDGAVAFKKVTTAQWGQDYIGSVNLKAGKTYIISVDAWGNSGRLSISKDKNTIYGDAQYLIDATFESGVSGTSIINSERQSAKFTSNLDQVGYVRFCAETKADAEAFTARIMIREASITDDTYATYGMSNAELTEEIKGRALNGSSEYVQFSQDAAISKANVSGKGIQDGIDLVGRDTDGKQWLARLHHAEKQITLMHTDGSTWTTDAFFTADEDTGWQTPDPTNLPNFKYRRKNGHVTVTGYGGVGGVAAKTTKTLFTLPEGFRPSIRVDSAAHLANGSNEPVCQFLVTTDGKVNVWANTEIASNVSVCGSVSFPV